MKDHIERALTAKRESRYIDFKGNLDFGQSHTWCEVVKDIVAMANSGGGVLLVGLNNKGIPTGFDPTPILELDPAEVIDQIHKYTGIHFDGFTISKQVKSGSCLAAIVVDDASIPIVFTKPGTYPVSEKKQKTAFSAGTVYFRHGAKSEPGNTDDIRGVVERRLELIRKSWLKGVRKVVQTPQSLQTLTVRSVGPQTSSTPVPTIVRAVNDPNAIPVRLTRDPENVSGAFVHEEVSEGIFDEINNVVDANNILAKGQQRFFLIEPVYFRIYAERHHVKQPLPSIYLLLNTAFVHFYAPGLYWLSLLQPEQSARVFVDLYLSSKYPNIHCLMRTAILLGADFCEWLYESWHDKWKGYSQPPQFYWAFKGMLSRLNESESLMVAGRTTPLAKIGLLGQRSASAKELIGKPELAASMLSDSCIAFFEGNSDAKSVARDLDFFAYAHVVREQAPRLVKAILSEIGDREAGDAAEVADDE